MRVIEGETVNELYFKGVTILRSEGRKKETRAGPALVMPCPVMSVYEQPTRRVLFDIKRKANPFFHLFESLWMLAGRDDVASLNTYITDFGTRFAEPDGRVHGAYGYRWRHGMGYDQLNAIVEKLRTFPQDRQAVLQMWDGRASDQVGAMDNGKPIMMPGFNDLLGNWRDRPCNTHVYFTVREEMEVDGLVGSFTSKSGMWPVLDMTVSCRSNDIIYGAYGANAVHFSVLQEYVAGRLGVLVGKMYQFSNNYHGYIEAMERIGEPSYQESYAARNVQPMPMATLWDKFDDDLETFMCWQKRLVYEGETGPEEYANKWFANTAEPMFVAHWKFRQAMQHEARSHALLIEADDWRYAAMQWFDSRQNNRSR